MTQTDRMNGITGSVAIKQPCRVATTANITLSGEQTIDGVAVVTDDRVLVKNQTTASQNGIYVADTGAWSRATDFDGNRDVVQGTLVNVTAGTTNAGTYWHVTTANPITIDTSSITWTQEFTATSITAANVQSGSYFRLSSVSGVDTITAVATPTLTAYAAGNTFRFISAGANTGAVTLNIDGLGAKAVTKNGTTALVAGDIPSAAYAEVYYDGTRFQLISGLKAGDIGVSVQAYDAELAAIAGLTFSQGGLIYGTGAAAAAVLPKGTASQQLRMNAGATAPEWFTAAASSGALVLLGTITAAAAASADVTSLITSTYDEYIFWLEEAVPGTDADGLLARTSTNNGSSFDSGAGNYRWTAFPANESGSARTGSAAATSISLLGTDTTYYAGNAAGECINGFIRLTNPLGTTRYKGLEWHLCGPGHSSSSALSCTGYGFRADTGDVDAFQILGLTTTITCKIRCYGVAKA